MQINLSNLKLKVKNGFNLIKLPRFITNLHMNTILLNLKLIVQSAGILLATLIGNLFPLWFGFLILIYFNQKSPDISIIYIHGDLLICSASLMTSAFLMKLPKFGIIIGCISFLMLGLLYTGVYTVDNISTTLSINIDLLRLGSYIIFTIACLLFFYMTIQDKKISTFDPKKNEDTESAKLQEKFNKVR
ncbi:hypothetical protein [Clostridium sp. DJ247]|uniref:hypothetical protein n=1 Tax=Clostridium sp. DJ247 TaxID=2726188 RepID=UPI0016255466|nr:hypothetical protein [Clostridium sp. DJ247]MBC2579171.1 hypothetical protein [Clostridium sp. DJ247]